MKLEELVKIGEDKYLSKKDILVFINFFSERFPNMRDKHYAEQWADRIRSKQALISSDYQSKKILLKYGYKGK